MIYVVIVLVLVAATLIFGLQRQNKTIADLKTEHQELLDHYQRRVNEQERAQSDFRELQKNFENVGEGYDQALLMYDKMQEESDKLQHANQLLQEQNATLQQNLGTAQESLKQANECLAQVADGISRELPALAATPEARKTTRRISALLRNAQNLAELKEDRPISKSDNVMLMQIADKAIEESGIKETGYLQFEVKTEGGAEATMLFTNAKQAARALTMLLDNAMKFVTDGGVTLRVVVDMDNSQVRYEVEDTGTGIPADEAEHVFEPFVKLNTFFDGQGLGLTTARNVARRLGGDVTLDTAHTPGARFVLALPL